MSPEFVEGSNHERPKVIYNNESTKIEMNCPRKSGIILPQIILPSWGLAFLLGAPSSSLDFAWYILYSTFATPCPSCLATPEYKA